MSSPTSYGHPSVREEGCKRTGLKIGVDPRKWGQRGSRSHIHKTGDKTVELELEDRKVSENCLPDSLAGVSSIFSRRKFVVCFDCGLG